MSETDSNPGQIILTLDADWVPDFVIEDVTAILAAHGLGATCFLTNPLRHDLPDIIEAGIHPNFLPGSTQGSTRRDVMDYLSAAVPGARSVRTHRLFWDADLPSLFRQYGIRYDVSVLLPFHDHLRPVATSGIHRLPFWWSDNFHLTEGLECAVDTLDGRLCAPGLKILSFHFIHVWLNSRSLDDWNREKQLFPEGLQYASREDLSALQKAGTGIGSLFHGVLRRLEHKRFVASTISQAMDGVTRN